MVLQITMAIMAAATTERSTASGRIIPLPIVAATAVPVTRAPTILSTAAMPTAWEGERTRVETTVAMALGASVQPLTNSAASTRRRTASSGRPISGMLQGDALQDIGYILAAVGGVLHLLVKLPPLDEPDEVGAVLKEL